MSGKVKLLDNVVLGEFLMPLHPAGPSKYLCERAEAAAVFDVFEVRLSRSVFDAAVAAFFPVVFLWATPALGLA